MKTIKVISFMLLVSITIFAAPQSKIIEKVLQLAGKNRPELQKVLDHYRNDSIKYKAAFFLIENMDTHYSQSYYWADSLNHKVQFNEFTYPDFKTSVNEFNKINSKRKLHPVVENFSDMETISAEYLINNIDDAFILKSKQWNSNLTDEQFFNYLLSYRVINEKFEPWRTEFRNTFAKFTYPTSNLSVRKTCTVLCDSLRNWFLDTYFLKNKNYEPAYLSPKQILFRRQGTCEDIADWGVYLLRSIGIAATVDFTPAWGTSTGSHYWNVAFDENGEEIPFFMGDDNPNEFRMVREPSKVFRITYKSQSEAIANILPLEEIPNGVLRNKYYLDVTNQYWKTTNMSFSLGDTVRHHKVAYIAVFNGLSWKPVWWSWIKQGNVNFSKTTCGVVYLPMYYTGGKLSLAAPPCILRTNNTIQLLKADVQNKRTITLEEKKGYLKYRSGKKYTLLYWDNNWIKVEQQTIGTENKLVFNNVPNNALMLLLPEYSEGKERPFTVNQDGKQEWW